METVSISASGAACLPLSSLHTVAVWTVCLIDNGAANPNRAMHGHHPLFSCLDSKEEEEGRALDGHWAVLLGAAAVCVRTLRRRRSPPCQPFFFSVQSTPASCAIEPPRLRQCFGEQHLLLPAHLHILQSLQPPLIRSPSHPHVVLASTCWHPTPLSSALFLLTLSLSGPPIPTPPPCHATGDQ